MAITTSIRPYYARWMMIVLVACAVVGLWGVYDYAIKLPREQRIYNEFVEVQQRMVELETKREQQGFATDDEITEHRRLEARLAELAPGGENPVPPSKFDWIFQWMCILCLPGAPMIYLKLRRQRRQQFRLDDDGTLHMPDPAGAWTPEDIVEIDMRRWMKKSIAEVVHRDGTRVKLDDYIYRDMDRIVGAIAHRLHPDHWRADARPATGTPAAEGAAAEAADNAADSDAARPTDGGEP